MSVAPWLAVATGSALGGLLRYVAARTWPVVSGGWPASTLAVNLLGSFAIGLLSVLLATRQPAAESARLFWMVGVLGGFTTYSTFAIEAVWLGESGQLLRASAYAALTLTGCIGAAWLGRTLAGEWF